MDKLQALIKSIQFNKRIEVDGRDYDYYCIFGFATPCSGEIRINQKGEVFIICEQTSDEPLDDIHYKDMADVFDAKHGVPLDYIKYVAQAYDLVARNLKDSPKVDKDELLQIVSEKISDECREFLAPENIGKGIIWCSAIRNYPEDFLDMIEGKEPEKKAYIDEYYLNLKKGDRNPFSAEDTSIFIEDVSIAVRCLNIEAIKENDSVRVLIEPQCDYIADITNIETNENGTVSVKKTEQYMVSTDLLSFRAHYKDARKLKKINFNSANPQNP